MHDDIRRFTTQGVVADKNLAETKNRLIHFEEGAMREKGCVPLLDMDPQFTLDYKGDGEYNFKLTLYGVFVGRGKACEISGAMNGKMIPKSTQTVK